MRSLFSRSAICVGFAFLSLQSCQKSQVTNQKDSISLDPTATKMSSAKVERMRTFLSITLSVPKDKVVYHSDIKKFSVRGTLKLDYASVESLYDEANEYKLKYE